MEKNEEIIKTVMRKLTEKEELTEVEIRGVI